MDKEYLIQVWVTVDNAKYRQTFRGSPWANTYPDYSHIIRSKLVEGEKARDRFLRSLRKKWAGPNVRFKVIERELAPWGTREVAP